MKYNKLITRCVRKEWQTVLIKGLQKNMKKLTKTLSLVAVVAAIALFTGEVITTGDSTADNIIQQGQKVWSELIGDKGNQTAVDVTDYSNTSTEINGLSIPQFTGESVAYTVNNNEPFFYEGTYTTETYIHFSDLDKYGRAGVADSIIGPETMQTHERGSLSSRHPSGWWEAKQTEIEVNRSHLIGNNLGGDVTDCQENLITGSRQLNAGSKIWAGSMLDYEIDVAEYIENTGNHVRYRVTPVFENVDVTPKGVLMEAESIEDQGEGLKFCTYIYNVQPDYVCNYTTGLWEHIVQPEALEEQEG